MISVKNIVQFVARCGGTLGLESRGSLPVMLPIAGKSRSCIFSRDKQILRAVVFANERALPGYAIAHLIALFSAYEDYRPIASRLACIPPGFLEWERCVPESLEPWLESAEHDLHSLDPLLDWAAAMAEHRYRISSVEHCAIQ